MLPQEQVFPAMNKTNRYRRKQTVTIVLVISKDENMSQKHNLACLEPLKPNSDGTTMIVLSKLDVELKFENMMLEKSEKSMLAWSQSRLAKT